VGRNSQNFAPHAFKIVVDIDQGELSKNTIEVNLPILSDVGIFIESLLVALRQGELRRAPYASWLAECQEITAQYPVLEPDYRHSSHINPYLFVKTLSAQLKEAAIIVADGCAVLQSVMQMFAFKNAQRLIAASGIELPGFAINSAIGVCVAAGRRPTLCLCESLGFHNATEELITISAENLPIKIVVMMNRSFSHVRRIQDDHFNSRYVGTNRDLNAWISSCSNFYGLPVTSLDSPINLAERLRERCESPGPEIILVKVDADRELIPRSVFVPQDSGRWHAESLDQMYPAYSPRTADKLKEGGNEKY
jgi:acetolactate synthase-1/2/3 large subunit